MNTFNIAYNYQYLNKLILALNISSTPLVMSKITLVKVCCGLMITYNTCDV